MKSDLEAGFLNYCRMCNVPMPAREYRFHPERKWRFDFAWLDVEPPLAVEIDGGQWMKSGHSTGTGKQRDNEKSNAAQLLGWTVLRYTTMDLHPKRGRPVQVMAEIKEALAKRKDAKPC